MAPKAPNPTRDGIRSVILSTENRNRKSKIINLFGQDVEIRQPTVGQVTEMAKSAGSMGAIVHTLIEYCYVPGSEDKVFTKEDAEELNALPTGAWLTTVNEAIEDMTGLSVKEAAKN